MVNNDETRLASYLPGDAPQTFIDVVHEVRLHIPSLPRRGLITFFLFGPPFSIPHQSDVGSPRYPATAPEEVFECFVPFMWSSGIASEITANPTLLQPIGHPEIQRWACGCMEG